MYFLTTYPTLFIINMRGVLDAFAQGKADDHPHREGALRVSWRGGWRCGSTIGLAHSPRDGVLIPEGREHRHMARVLMATTVFVEDV